MLIRRKKPRVFKRGDLVIHPVVGECVVDAVFHWPRDPATYHLFNQTTRVRRNVRASEITLVSA